MVLKIKNPPSIHKKIAAKKEAFSGEGFRIDLNLKFSGMNAVESKFTDSLLNGPEIKPSISGTIAAEIMNDVRRKLALRYFFKRADKRAIPPENAAEIKKQRVTAKIGLKFLSEERMIAVKNPPV